MSNCGSLASLQSPGTKRIPDRFIWTDSCFASGDGMPFIGGETERNGTYILNFFSASLR